MAADITFFPVGCGDMTLVKLADAAGTTLLLDIRILAAADDPDDETPDVAKQLRDRLKRDSKGRPYVDAFLNSHPDDDHITGFEKHFWSGPLSEYPDDKKPDNEKRIVINEIWCSQLVYNRASKTHRLVADAKAFNKEARRRIEVNRNKQCQNVGNGDRVLIMGEDEEFKDLTAIVIKSKSSITKINGVDVSQYFSAYLLAPLPADDDEEDEVLSKNNSSVILNIKLASDARNSDACKFLTGGDAEVVIWEKLWELNKNTTDNLEYDLLETPHHCSWHSLSHDSWSSKRENAKVSKDARSALGQARDGAYIVASSKAIKDDDCDPPCIRAKREYEDILKGVGGTFVCTGEYPSEDAQEPLVFNITSEGPQLPARKASAAKAASVLSAARTPMPHGRYGGH